MPSSSSAVVVVGGPDMVVVGTALTSGAVSVIAAQFRVPASTHGIVWYRASGKNAALTGSFYGIRSCGFRRAGTANFVDYGNTSIVAANSVLAGVTTAFNNVAPDILELRVLGVAGQDITWEVWADVFFN